MAIARHPCAAEPAGRCGRVHNQSPFHGSDRANDTGRQAPADNVACATTKTALVVQLIDLDDHDRLALIAAEVVPQLV